MDVLFTYLSALRSEFKNVKIPIEQTKDENITNIPATPKIKYNKLLTFLIIIRKVHHYVVAERRNFSISAPTIVSLFSNLGKKKVCRFSSYLIIFD